MHYVTLKQVLRNKEHGTVISRITVIFVVIIIIIFYNDYENMHLLLGFIIDNI